MSMPKVKLHVQAIPKTLVRVGCAGDFLKNVALGTMSDQEIRDIQQGVAEGLIQTIWVTGLDSFGIPRERFWLKFDPLSDDVKVMLDLSDGKSTLEAVDVGLAGGVQTAVQVLRRKNLRPDVTFDYTADALANPTRLNEAKQRLGFTARTPLQPIPSDTSSAPAWTPPALNYTPSTSYPPLPVSTPSPPRPVYAPPAGFALKNAITLTPAKDSGMHFGWDTLRRS